MKDIQIRLLKADFPNVNTKLFEGRSADQITKHFILEYPGLTFSLLKRNAFYLHLYPYLEMIQSCTLNEIFTCIAQDFQNFEISAYSMN